MERKDIGFTGLGLAVSDLDAADGELSVSHNIIRDNGAMRPVLLPEEHLSLEEGERLLYIHRVASRKHYIVESGGSLHYFTDESEERSFVASVMGSDTKIWSVGNTLVVISGGELKYVLYRDGEYRDIGQKPPELDIQWGLRGKAIEKNNEKRVTLAEKLEDAKPQVLSESNQDVLTNAVGGLTNTLIAECDSNGMFTRSFFVRAAYTMLGDSYMATPPVLMRLNEGRFPLVGITLNEDGEGLKDGTVLLNIRAYAARLLMSLAPGVLTKLQEDWKDVVTGIDVYVSSPITRYDKDVKVEGVSNNGADSISISVLEISGESGAGKVVADGAGYFLDGMQKEKEVYYSQFAENSQFYLLKHFNVEDMTYSSYEINESLSNVESLPKLRADDFQEHDVLTAEGAFVYNSRLNLFGVKEKKYNFPMRALVQKTDGYRDDSGYVSDYYDYRVRFVLESGNETVEVTNIQPSYLYEEPVYLFYPDNGVKEAIVERTRGGVTERAYLPMKSHPEMQGCFWFNNFGSLTWTTTTERLTNTEGVAEEDGKIYTSDVNNPFRFPLGGINRVGTGLIVGISTVTKALSQGQFGQFPLYVFSSEGIWAMEVGADGLYSSIKPLSRDVCINGDSITQTDNAVLFVSEKGVMMIDGSEVNCLSEMMNGRSFDVGSVGMLDEVMAKEGMPSGLNGMVDFMAYARSARMAYDYPNGRVLLFSEGKDYVYLFSMNSGTWATLGVSVEGSVPDYPDVYVQSGSEVINLSGKVDYDDGRKVKTLLVTRPVKMDDDGYKTVYEMVAAGAMDRRLGAVLLWGSHDGMEYVLIKAVNGNRLYRTGGSGYRYFRIGVVGEMTVGEKLSMVSLLFRRKYGNRLR